MFIVETLEIKKGKNIVHNFASQTRKIVVKNKQKKGIIVTIFSFSCLLVLFLGARTVLFVLFVSCFYLLLLLLHF